MALRDLPDARDPGPDRRRDADADTLPRSLRGVMPQRTSATASRLVRARSDGALRATGGDLETRAVARARAGRSGAATPPVVRDRPHLGRPQECRSPTTTTTPTCQGDARRRRRAAAWPRRRRRHRATARDHLSEQFATASAGLAEVAQRVAVTLGERRLYTALRTSSRLSPSPARYTASSPSSPVVAPAGAAPRHQLIISANYDSALERAFEDANEPFDYAVYVAGEWLVRSRSLGRTGRPSRSPPRSSSPGNTSAFRSTMTVISSARSSSRSMAARTVRRAVSPGATTTSSPKTTTSTTSRLTTSRITSRFRSWTS